MLATTKSRVFQSKTPNFGVSDEKTLESCVSHTVTQLRIPKFLIILLATHIELLISLDAPIW